MNVGNSYCIVSLFRVSISYDIVIKSKVYTTNGYNGKILNPQQSLIPPFLNDARFSHCMTSIFLELKNTHWKWVHCIYLLYLSLSPWSSRDLQIDQSLPFSRPFQLPNYSLEETSVIPAAFAEVVFFAWSTSISAAWLGKGVPFVEYMLLWFLHFHIASLYLFLASSVRKGHEAKQGVKVSHWNEPSSV